MKVYDSHNFYKYEIMRRWFVCNGVTGNLDVQTFWLNGVFMKKSHVFGLCLRIIVNDEGGWFGDIL